MQNDILFDNIYIGHSIEDAERFQAETFDIKHAIEEKEDQASEPEPETKKKARSPMDLKFFEDPVHYVREKLDLFITIAKNDPVQAIKFVPEVAAGLGVTLLAVLAALIGLMSMGASSSPQVKKAAEKVKETVVEKKDQVVEATASGIEKVEAEVQKRTTRSQTQQ